MLIADAVRRGNNNFDLLRLVAAAMVIVGHSYALVPVKGEIDPIQALVGFAYSGSLAVKFFFFLSGILVTNSLLQKQDIIEFVTMRTARVVPAIAVCSAILALIIGPIFTTDTKYFSNPDVFRFIWGNSIINIQYTLPGVFQNLAFKEVNASLWTIPYEVCAYIVLAGFFLIGALKNKHVAAAICVFFIVYSLLPQGGDFFIFLQQ
ncbi:acyltransferase [Brucella sp. 458]|uniref:acyltransferase family protein n=1 Tax=Brucella sp. 458 TaxID=2821140 RepID=UPI001ADF0558|nr:acyltransferase [Brucella sp. 458]QTN98579.1 acyltransferase [Brucella sp. 458]